MTNSKEAWDEVGNRVAALGLKLKLHYEQAESDEVQTALRKLGDALDSAFEAVGSAVKDPAVRDDAIGVGKSLVDALGVSLQDAGEELRAAVRRER